MNVDGKAIANQILDDLRVEVNTLGITPILTVFTCEPNFETELFLRRKCKLAESIGVRVRVIEFDREACQQEIILSINHAASDCDGIIVQLPFPKRIDISEVLMVVPPQLDVDALSYDGEDDTILPPVVGAIKAILEKHEVTLPGKKVAVVGQGRLVGIPTVFWCKAQGAKVTTFDKQNMVTAAALKDVDVIISGAGIPGLIESGMVPDGAIVLDAGTSEESGVLKGDVAPEVVQKASLFTPVPGGIGPITVAVLLKNLVELTKQARNQTTL